MKSRFPAELHDARGDLTGMHAHRSLIKRRNFNASCQRADDVSSDGQAALTGRKVRNGMAPTRSIRCRRAGGYLRRFEPLARIGAAFDSLAHTVDVGASRIRARFTRGCLPKDRVGSIRTV